MKLGILYVCDDYECMIVQYLYREAMTVCVYLQRR